MENKDSSQVCTRCYCSRPIEDFLAGKNDTRTRCRACRDHTSQAKKRKRQEINNYMNEKENTINFTNIIDHIYYELLELKNLNDNLEGQSHFQLQFDVDLDSVYENLSIEVVTKDKNLQIADLIINAISSGDGYIYVLQKTYNSKNSEFATLIYWCNARKELCKHQKKVENISNQRNRETVIERYECEGLVTIKIYPRNIVTVNISHKILHPRLEKINVTEDIKNYINSCIGQSVPTIYQSIKDYQINGYELLTIKQVYYWWSSVMQAQYRYSNDEFTSAKTFLQKHKQKILFFKDYGFAFTTTFFDILPLNSLMELMVDATYNTNKLKYELYGAMAIVDGAGFPISYLFIAPGKNRDITNIITEWFVALKTQQLANVRIFYTDKDLSQINAAKATWNNIKVQLCLWHVNRAVEQKLSSRTKVQVIRYNAIEAHEQCKIIDPLWQPTLSVFNEIYQENTDRSKSGYQLAKKETRMHIKNLMSRHCNRHMLIPKEDKTFVNQQEIWIECITEIYQYCRNNDLIMVWAYLWCEWYTPKQWVLWARSSFEEIGILRTTMVIESHWRLLKRDYLYKFNRPRLDLLCFIIIKKVFIYIIFTLFLFLFLILVIYLFRLLHGNSIHSNYYVMSDNLLHGEKNFRRNGIY